jgi:secreted PhoX family phosphatase
MPKDVTGLEDSNRSANPCFYEVSDPACRAFVRAALAGAAAVLGRLATGCAGMAKDGAAADAARRIGFTPMPMQEVDIVLVPPGYTARVLYR